MSSMVEVGKYVTKLELVKEVLKTEYIPSIIRKYLDGFYTWVNVEIKRKYN